VAFESGTNVCAVHRAEPFADNGSPWHAGRRELVSVGLGGAPANGPSTAPAVDGTSRVAPHCVAFVSAASNLVRGDTNGVRDAMLATEPSGDRWLLAEHGGGGPTTNPVTSPHGNYVVFERGGHVHLLHVGEK
jgi:hypothetical protein